MGVAYKAISKKFLNIFIRTNPGQTEIVMQYGDLWSSVTCMTTSSSNDSFASPTHRTNCWIQACGMLFHSCTSAACNFCSVSGGVWRWRTCLPSSFHKCSIGDNFFFYFTICYIFLQNISKFQEKSFINNYLITNYWFWTQCFTVLSTFQLLFTFVT